MLMGYCARFDESLLALPDNQDNLIRHYTFNEPKLVKASVSTR